VLRPVAGIQLFACESDMGDVGLSLGKYCSCSRRRL